MRAIQWLMASLLLAALLALGWYGDKQGWLSALGRAAGEQIAALSSNENAAIAIESFTLSNGLKVHLLPNARVPAISHMLWLRVGAADDPQGKSGLAHFHEHLMFKGTPSAPESSYSQRIEAVGGEFNAFTGSDFTGFYVNVAREHLEAVMQLESDRMQHLAPTNQDYLSEREVIIEERYSRTDSNPDALWNEQMQAALFLHHPYRIPVIGWKHEMQQLTQADAQAFYAKHYHAGNMVLIVAGDISRAELEPLAQRYYGSLPARTPNARAWTQEPPALAPRQVHMRHAEVSSPRWQRRYLVPSHGSGATAQQVMSLSLLSQHLGGGKLSLLYQQLVEQQALAVAVSASYSGLSQGPAQFVIEAQPSSGVPLASLEAAIDGIMASLGAQPIAADDLQRIKSLYRASATYARDGLSGLAQYAGYLVMLDLPLEYLTQWEQQVEAITPLDMQQAAALLNTNASVTGSLLPEAATAPTEIPHAN